MGIQTVEGVKRGVVLLDFLWEILIISSMVVFGFLYLYGFEGVEIGLLLLFAGLFGMMFFTSYRRETSLSLPKKLPFYVFGLGGILAINILVGEIPFALMVAETVAVLMSIPEEQFFRGFMYKWLDPYGNWTATLVSTGTWTVYHFLRYGTQLDALWIVFLSGVILAYILEATNRLSVVMAIHMTVNLLAGVTS